MCALDFVGENDSCGGNDGGPIQMFVNDSAIANFVGIVSFGVLPCGTAFANIYTRVAYYLEWIESIVWQHTTINNGNQ